MAFKSAFKLQALTHDDGMDAMMVEVVDLCEDHNEAVRLIGSFSNGNGSRQNTGRAI